MISIFAVLTEKGNTKRAIRYPKRIIKGWQGTTSTEITSGTKLHELVEELTKDLTEKTQRYFYEKGGFDYE